MAPLCHINNTVRARGIGKASPQLIKKHGDGLIDSRLVLLNIVERFVERLAHVVMVLHVKRVEEIPRGFAVHRRGGRAVELGLWG